MIEDVVLYSGGLDSYISAYRILREKEPGSVKLAYVPLGHRYQDEEVRAIKRTYPDTIFLRGLERMGILEHEDAYIPARNAHLILRASQLLEGPGRIWLTVQRDEMDLSDRTDRFRAVAGVMVSALTGYDVTVLTPWITFDKADMVTWYIMNGGDVETLKATHSCYRPGIIPCGNCSACIRRYIAMSLNGIEEEYEQDPRESDCAKEYIEAAKSGARGYSEKRCERIFAALGKEEKC